MRYGIQFRVRVIMKRLNEIKSFLLLIRFANGLKFLQGLNKRLMLISPMIIFLLSCASSKNITNQISDERFGDTETLNYEYTNRSLSSEAEQIHYLVNTEIDDPLVVRVTFPNIKGIHPAVPAEGLAIVQFTSNERGEVLKYRFVKRAGLGLDDYVETMVKGIKIEPLVHKGEKRGSVFNVRFIFREKP